LAVGAAVGAGIVVVVVGGLMITVEVVEKVEGIGVVGGTEFLFCSIEEPAISAAKKIELAINTL
jgi:hypothetical protein